MYRGMREGGHEQSGQLITAERRKEGRKEGGREGGWRIMTKEDLSASFVPGQKKGVVPAAADATVGRSTSHSSSFPSSSTPLRLDIRQPTHDSFTL